MTNGPAARRVSLVIPLLAALVYAANVYRYHLVQWDDAYITFRFAQHLAEGRGLIWNVGGERVEGYSSLLHVVLLSVGMRVGVRPEVASVTLSILAVLATVGILWTIVRRHEGAVHPFAAIVLSLYLADRPTAIHSTSGLETQLFVALLCAAYAVALRYSRSPDWRVGVGLAGVVFLGVLCRPEGVLFGAALYAVLALRTTWRPLVPGVALLLMLGLAYGVGKYRYFGYLLPNPYYVKSNRVSLAGLRDVALFLVHVSLWYAPLIAGIVYLQRRHGGPVARRDDGTRQALFLALTPSLLALAYYATIVHEVGGAYRFSYPAYGYLVLAAALWVSRAARALPQGVARRSRLALGLALYVGVLLGLQGSWRLAALPVPDFNQHFFKIGSALRDTGLGWRASVMCNAAGIIPYISGFNHVDPSGLTDNFLAGRIAASAVERERYLWNRNPDVYVGFEPPALAGALRPEDDPRMNTSYVTRVLLGRRMSPVWSRVFVHDRELLHARMCELRDHWDWMGELEWPGWQLWRLKSFLYVRTGSPHAVLLRAQLAKIVATPPERIDLDDLR